MMRKDAHFLTPKRGMPPCTRSQVIGYRRHGRELVAVVHQYVLASGRLGASGRPDPKLLLHDGVLYRAFEPHR
jgi:hypothetical protein